MFEVFNKSCNNCLLSKDSIVSPERRKDILDTCKEKQIHFICHLSSIEGGQVCCKKFFDEMGNLSRMIRLCKEFKLIKEIEMPESKDKDGFISHNEIEKIIKNRKK